MRQVFSKKLMSRTCYVWPSSTTPPVATATWRKGASTPTCWCELSQEKTKRHQENDKNEVKKKMKDIGSRGEKEKSKRLGKPFKTLVECTSDPKWHIQVMPWFRMMFLG